MRLALQALFSSARDLSEDGVRQRAKIENELRNNPRSAEFYRKLELSVSDPRLKAPEIFGAESFPDSNIVAEYLDASLESLDLCDEYEKLCLERPEALAEAGDCYDILNNRLCHAAKAPKNCRRRLYHIAWEEEGSDSIPIDLASEDSHEDRENDNHFEDASLEGLESPSEEKAVKSVSNKSSSKKKRGRRSVAELGKKTASFGAKSLLALLVTIGGLRLFAATRARFAQDPAPLNEMTAVENIDARSSEQRSVTSSGFLSVPEGDSQPSAGDVTTEPLKLVRDFDVAPPPVMDRPQRWNDSELETDVQEDMDRITDGNELRNPMTIPFQNNDVFSDGEESELP